MDDRGGGNGPRRLSRPGGIEREDGSVEYRMSPATLFWSRFGRAFYAVNVAAIVASGDKGDPWLLILAGMFWLTFILLLDFGGANVVAEARGLEVRNILFAWHYPWAAVAGFDATDRLVVVRSDGRRTRCWAVQKANAAMMFNKDSRVDYVAAELDAFRTRVGIASDPGVSPSRRFRRFSRWELLQMFAVFPAIVVGAWWISVARR
ncbi:PH domain-containing protein [Xylanimonas allomyrinae]|uniref:PH domain-containing protein n=1 Tax=Xylanimonas allomyrinae TaxID=2509459 RepID=UPI0013A67ED3|nr:PH domain-containing protein [Xylanimonas allomyrinae]